MEKLTFKCLDVHGSQIKGTECLTFYGRQSDSKTVALHIVDYLPYIYVYPVPDDKVLRNIENKLQVHLQCEKEIKKSTEGYGSTMRSYAKIIVPKFNFIKILAHTFIESGYEVYEFRFSLPVKFYADSNIGGCNWISVPPYCWTIQVISEMKSTRCDIEATARLWKHVKRETVIRENVILPFIGLSFDIECLCDNGIFPRASFGDPIIQISCVTDSDKVVFVTGGPCDELASGQVVLCADETDLLCKWVQFVQDVDPDFLCGYNIELFDLPYIAERWKMLVGYQQPLLLGRSKMASKINIIPMSNKKREKVLISIPGRVVMDVMQCIMREHRLNSYKLDDVAKYFLNEEKLHDVSYKDIPKFHKESPATRALIARYCLRDSQLVYWLVKKLQLQNGYQSLSQICGVPLTELLTKGMSVRSSSALLHKAHVHDMVLSMDGDKVSPISQRKFAQAQATKYEGATVMTPLVGFYSQPVSVVDYNSLYPNTIRTYNICPTTHVKCLAEVKHLSANDYIVLPGGTIFVKEHIQKGILPVIVEELVTKRKEIKRQIKDILREGNDQNMGIINVLDCMQQSLKVCANSLYGFTGKRDFGGNETLLSVARTITACGRNTLNQTKVYVESKIEFNAQVIYGDTDSLFISYGDIEHDVNTAISRTKLLAQMINTDQFGDFSSMVIEYEKTYKPFLLIAKKIYAGKKYTDCKEDGGIIHQKGTASVRRDNCPLFSKVLVDIFDLVLSQENIKAAVSLVKNVVYYLCQGEYTYDELSFSKAYKERDRLTSQPHVKVVESMRARGERNLPTEGDRIRYVIVNNKPGGKGSLCDKAEDVKYAECNGLPIDIDYYMLRLERQVASIMEPILGGKENIKKLIFNDNYPKKIKSTYNKGIMKYFHPISK